MGRSPRSVTRGGLGGISDAKKPPPLGAAKWRRRPSGKEPARQALNHQRESHGPLVRVTRQCGRNVSAWPRIQAARCKRIEASAIMQSCGHGREGSFKQLLTPPRWSTFEDHRMRRPPIRNDRGVICARPLSPCIRRLTDAMRGSRRALGSSRRAEGRAPAGGSAQGDSRCRAVVNWQAVQSFCTCSRRSADAARARWRPVAAARSCLRPAQRRPPAAQRAMPLRPPQRTTPTPDQPARPPPSDTTNRPASPTTRTTPPAVRVLPEPRGGVTSSAEARTFIAWYLSATAEGGTRGG